MKKTFFNTLLALTLSACSSQAVVTPTITAEPTATKIVETTQEKESIDDIVLINSNYMTQGMITEFWSIGKVGELDVDYEDIEKIKTPSVFWPSSGLEFKLDPSRYPMVDGIMGNLPLEYPFSFQFSWFGEGYSLEDDLHRNLGGRVLLDGEEIANQHELNWIEGIDGYFMVEVPFVPDHPLMLRDTEMHEITLELHYGKNGHIYDDEISYELTTDLMTMDGRIIERPSFGEIDITFKDFSLSEFTVGNFAFIEGEWTTDALAEYGGKDIFMVLVDFDYLDITGYWPSLNGQQSDFEPDAYIEFDKRSYKIPEISGFGATEVAIINKITYEVFSTHLERLKGYGSPGHPDQLVYNLGFCPKEESSFDLELEGRNYKLSVNPKFVEIYGEKSLAMAGHINDGKYATSLYSLADGDAHIPNKGLAWVAIGTYSEQDFLVCGSNSFIDIPIQVYDQNVDRVIFR